MTSSLAWYLLWLRRGRLIKKVAIIAEQMFCRQFSFKNGQGSKKSMEYSGKKCMKRYIARVNDQPAPAVLDVTLAFFLLTSLCDGASRLWRWAGTLSNVFFSSRLFRHLGWNLNEASKWKLGLCRYSFCCQCATSLWVRMKQNRTEQNRTEQPGYGTRNISFSY